MNRNQQLKQQVAKRDSNVKNLQNTNKQLKQKNKDKETKKVDNLQKQVAMLKTEIKILNERFNNKITTLTEGSQEKETEITQLKEQLTKEQMKSAKLQGKVKTLEEEFSMKKQKTEGKIKASENMASVQQKRNNFQRKNEQSRRELTASKNECAKLREEEAEIYTEQGQEIKPMPNFSGNCMTIGDKPSHVVLQPNVEQPFAYYQSNEAGR